MSKTLLIVLLFAAIALAQPPIATHIVSVPYPQLPRMARISGDVRLSLKIPSEGGQPVVSITSGHKLLAGGAKQRWKNGGLGHARPALANSISSLCSDFQTESVRTTPRAHLNSIRRGW